MKSESLYDDLISERLPLGLTFFRHAKKNDGGVACYFDSFEEVADWFSRDPVRRKKKTRVPLFTRGHCDGNRLKSNVQSPLLVILDFDKVAMPIEKVSAAFRLYEIDHCGYSTHSHGKAEGVYSYRIFTDHLATTWSELRDIVEQLFAIVGIEGDDVTPESYNSPGWFVPAVHPDRAEDYQYISHLTGGSRWFPERNDLTEYDRKPDPIKPIEDMDVTEVREALAYIPNEEREDWIQIGMALHATGHEDAFVLWDEWSAGQDYADYDEAENERIWDSFRECQNGVGLGTIFFRARELDWDPTPSASDDFAGWKRDEVTGEAEPSWTLEGISNRKAALRRMNERYAFVAEGHGRVADLMPPDGSPVEMMTTTAFDGYYASPKFPGLKVDRNGDPIFEPIAKLWRQWKGMQRFKKRDFMPPGGPPLSPETLNVWRGWGFNPSPSGSCDLYLAHVRDNICSGNDEWYNWTIAWLAHLFQQPWQKPGTALVLRSGEGTGKGIFAGAIKDLCGCHGLHVMNSTHLTGQFNTHLFGRLLIFADEVTWGGRKQEEGILKALISEGDSLMEPKGVDAKAAHQFFRLIISSNLEWVIPAGPDARRWQVFDVSERQKQNLPYFLAILKQMRHGGNEALLHYLLNVDMRDLPDPNRIIATEALARQKVESFDLMNAWVHQILSAGNLGNAHEWPTDWIAARTLYDSYLETAAEVGEVRRRTETTVGRRLTKIFGSQIRRRRTRVGDEDRVRQVRLPSLDQARKIFESEVINGEYNWPEESDDGEE